LKRYFEGKYGKEISTIKQRLSEPDLRPLTIVVDSIQGGGQLLSALREHTEQLLARGQLISILPYHATQHGIETVKDEVHPNLRALLEFNLKRSTVTENVRGTSSIPVPEIQHRLMLLGCKPQILTQVMDFAKGIGDQLVRQNLLSNSVGPLGRRNLGLTTIIDGYPGQGTLPMLWLNSPPGYNVNWTGHSGKLSTPWKALLPHHHDQTPRQPI
jgi:hypothetical protein